MSRADELAQAYDTARLRLTRMAYSILGSHSDAEDAVSDAWLRLASADSRERVLDVEAWSTVAVARVAYDALRSTRSRRETYIGPWLPDPLVERLPSGTDPADRITLDDTVSYALLVVLESLTPAERTAFVLHDLFALPFLEVAAAVGRSPDAVRQLASRARSHIRASTPRLKVDAENHKQTVTAFLDAAAGGNLQGLLSLLDPDVVTTCDGGGQVSAARRPVAGAEKVSRFIMGLFTVAPGREARLVMVNGALGFACFQRGALDFVASVTTTAGQIATINIVRAPGKLEQALTDDRER